MNLTVLTKILASGRSLFGFLLMTAPGEAAESWLGEDAYSPGGRVAVRALGVRDLVLGAGLLRAIARDEPIEAWIDAGIAADLVDAAATLTSWKSLGRRRALPVVALATSAAATGVYIRLAR